LGLAQTLYAEARQLFEQHGLPDRGRLMADAIAQIDAEQAYPPSNGHARTLEKHSQQ
jgi:hypothetical protein